MVGTLGGLREYRAARVDGSETGGTALAVDTRGGHRSSVRAVLILGALMAWGTCLLGAVLLTGYLAISAFLALRSRHLGDGRVPKPPPWGSVGFLAVFAVVMIAFGALLAAPSLLKEPSGSIRSAAAWAALPSWSALAAAVTAAMLRRRRKASMRAVHARLV